MVETNKVSLPHDDVVQAKETIDHSLQTTELKESTGIIYITVEEPTGQDREVVLALQRPLLAQNSVLYDIINGGELSISGELQITSSADWRNTMDLLIAHDEDEENNRPLVIVSANCQASDSSISRDTSSIVMDEENNSPLVIVSANCQASDSSMSRDTSTIVMVKTTELQSYISSSDMLLHPEASTQTPQSLLVSKPRAHRIVPKVSFHIKKEFEPARNVNKMMKRTRSETSLIDQMSSIGPFNAGFSVYDVTLRRSLPTQAEYLPNPSQEVADSSSEYDESSKTVINEKSFIRRGTYGNVIWPLKTHLAETHEANARKPTLSEYIKRKSTLIKYLKKGSGSQTTNELTIEQDNPASRHHDLNKSDDYAELEIGVTDPHQNPILESTQEKRKISEIESIPHHYYATNIMNACCPNNQNGCNEWGYDNKECLSDNKDEKNEKIKKSNIQNKTRSFNKNLNAKWKCIQQHFYNEKWHKSIWTSNAGRKSRSFDADAHFKCNGNTLGERSLVLRCICGKAVWPLNTHQPEEYKANATQDSVKKDIKPKISGLYKSVVKPSLSNYLMKGVKQGHRKMKNEEEQNLTYKKLSGVIKLEGNVEVETLDNGQSKESDYFLCQQNKEETKHSQIKDNEAKYFNNGYTTIYITKCSGDYIEWGQANVEGLKDKGKQIEGNLMWHESTGEQTTEGTNLALKTRNKNTLTNRFSKNNSDFGTAIFPNHPDSGIIKQEVCKTVTRGSEIDLRSRNQYGYTHSTAYNTNLQVEESTNLSKNFASIKLETGTFERALDLSKSSPHLFTDLNATLPKKTRCNSITHSSEVTFNPPSCQYNNKFLFQSIPNLQSFPKKMGRIRKNKMVIETILKPVRFTYTKSLRKEIILSKKMMPLSNRKNKLFGLTCVDSVNKGFDRCSKSHHKQTPIDKKFISFENGERKNLNYLSRNDALPFALYCCASLKPSYPNSKQRCHRMLINIPESNMSCDKDKGLFFKLIKKITSFSQRAPSEKSMIDEVENQKHRKWCKMSRVLPQNGLEGQQSSQVVENQVIVILVSPSTYKYKMDFLYLFCTISQLRQKSNNTMGQVSQNMNGMFTSKGKLYGSQKQFTIKKTSSILNLGGKKNDDVTIKNWVTDTPTNTEKKNGDGDTFSANEMHLYNSLDFMLPIRQSFVVGSLTGLELDQGAVPNPQTYDKQQKPSVQAFGYEIVDANRTTHYSDLNANFQHVPYNVSVNPCPASTRSNLCETDRPIRDKVQLLLHNEWSDLTRKRNKEIESKQGNNPNLTQRTDGATAPSPKINTDCKGRMHTGFLNNIHTRSFGIHQYDEVYRKCPEKLYDKTMLRKFVSSIDSTANDIFHNSEKMKYEEDRLEPTLEKHQSLKSRETKYGYVCTSKSMFSNFSTSISNKVANGSRNIDLKQAYPTRIENMKPTYSESTNSIKSFQHINPKSTYNSISHMFNTNRGHHNVQFNWMDHKNKRYMNEIFQDNMTVLTKRNKSIKSRLDTPVNDKFGYLNVKHRSCNCSIYETGNSSAPVPDKHFSQWNFNENSLKRTNIFDLFHTERKSNKTSQYNRDRFEAKYKLETEIPRLLGGRRTSKILESKKSMARTEGSSDSNPSHETPTEMDSVCHHSLGQPISHTTEHHSLHAPKNSKDLSAEEKRRQSIKDKLKKIENKRQREAERFNDETELNVVNYDSKSIDKTKKKDKDQNIYSKHDPKLCYVDLQESKYKPWLEQKESCQNHENTYFLADEGRSRKKREDETKYVLKTTLQHSSDSDTSLVSSKSVIHLKNSRGSAIKREKYGNSNTRLRSKGVPPAHDEIVCRHKVYSHGPNHYNTTNIIDRMPHTLSSKRVLLKESNNGAADIILIDSGSECHSNNMKKGISLSEFNVYRIESSKQTDVNCSFIAPDKHQYIITKRNIDKPEGKKQSKYTPDLDDVYMIRQKDISGHNLRCAKRNKSLCSECFDLREDDGYSGDSASTPQIQKNATSKKTYEAFQMSSSQRPQHMEPHSHSSSKYQHSDQQKELKIKKPQREYSHMHKKSEYSNDTSETIVSVIDLETGNKDHAKVSKGNSFQPESNNSHPLLFKHGYTLYRMSENDEPCGVKHSYEQKMESKHYYDQTKPKVEEKNNLIKRFSQERQNSVSLQSDFLRSGGRLKTIETSPYNSKHSTKKNNCKINKLGSPRTVKQANSNDNRAKNEHAQVSKNKKILAKQSSLKKPNSTASLESYRSHKFINKSSENTSLTNLNEKLKTNEVTEEDKSMLRKSLSGSQTPLIALKTGQKSICKQGDVLYVPILVVSDNSISKDVISPLENLIIPQDNRKIMQMLEKTLNEHPQDTCVSENIKDTVVKEERPITATRDNSTKESGTLLENCEIICVEPSNQNDTILNKEQSNIGWSAKIDNEKVLGNQEEKQHEEEYLQQLINSNAENREEILSQCVEVRNEQGVIRREILQFDPEEDPARSSYYQFKCNDIDCTGNCVNADHRYYHVSIKDPVGNKLEASCDEPRLRVVLDVFNFKKDGQSDGQIMYSKINVRQPDECGENYKKPKCSEKELNGIEMLPCVNKSSASILRGKGIIPEMKGPKQENKMPNPLLINNESEIGKAVPITPPNYLVLAQTGSVFFHKAKIADSIANENQLNGQPNLFDSAIYTESKFEYFPRLENDYRQTPISNGEAQMENDTATNLTAERKNVDSGNMLGWNEQRVAKERNSELETDVNVNRYNLAKKQGTRHPKRTIKSVFNRSSLSRQLFGHSLRGKSKGLKNKTQRKNKYFSTDNMFNKFTSLNDISYLNTLSVPNIDSDNFIDNNHFQSRKINKSYSNDNFNLLNMASKLCSKTDSSSFTDSVTSMSSMKREISSFDKRHTNLICSTDAIVYNSVKPAQNLLSSTFSSNYTVSNDTGTQQKRGEMSQNEKKAHKCNTDESIQLHKLNNIEMLLDKTERKFTVCVANKGINEAIDHRSLDCNSIGSSRSILNSHGSIDMARIMEKEEKKLCHQWLSNVLQRKYAEQSLSCQINGNFDDSESEDELNECSLAFSANKLCSHKNSGHSTCQRNNELSTRDLADGLRKLCNKTRCTTAAEGQKSKSMQIFLENTCQSENVEVLPVPPCPQVEDIELKERANYKVEKAQKSNHCPAAIETIKKNIVHPNIINKLTKVEEKSAKIETMDQGMVMCKSAMTIPKFVDKRQFRGDNNFQVQSSSNGFHDYHSNNLNKQEDQGGFTYKVPLRQNHSLVWNNKQQCKKTSENLRNVSSNPTERMDGHQYINSLMGHGENNVYSIEVETSKSNSCLQGDTEGKTKRGINWQAYSDKHLIEMSVHTIPNRRKLGKPY